MKKNGRKSSWGWLIVLLIFAVAALLVLAAAANRRAYRRLAAVTPTPSITPRTVRITQDPALPAATPTPRLLLPNDVGIEVKRMQLRLAELGYFAGEADGQYGDVTRAAVEAFQRQNGLDADGKAGENTLQLLYDTSAQRFSSTPTPTSTSGTALDTLSNGSKGDQVVRLQERLKALGYYSGAVDGDFGKGTQGAVIAFQRQNGLDADGIAGEKTLTLLYSEAAKRFEATPTPESVRTISDAVPLLVNKSNPLPQDFVPADLVDMSEYCDASLVKIKYPGTQGVRQAVDALMEMLAAAREDGVTNWQVSAAYRSISDQQRIFDEKVQGYIKKNGLSKKKAVSAARQTVADPGSSEHHTGLAFDITVPNTDAFVYTDQCKWMHQHCWDYGFIVRYQKDKEDITGFLAEAWHIRYVGKEHSVTMRDRNLCLEEYIDLLAL